MKDMLIWVYVHAGWPRQWWRPGLPAELSALQLPLSAYCRPARQHFTGDKGFHLSTISTISPTNTHKYKYSWTHWQNEIQIKKLEETSERSYLKVIFELKEAYKLCTGQYFLAGDTVGVNRFHCHALIDLTADILVVNTMWKCRWTYPHSVNAELGMMTVILDSFWYKRTELCKCVSSQEPSVMTEDDNGSDNSQFTGSTINLQDLEWPPQSCRSQVSCDDRPHRHFVTVHSLHQQTHPFPRTFESIFWTCGLWRGWTWVHR